MSNNEFDISFDLPKNQSNVIKVIGVGGGGSNAINHMFEQGINGVDFVVCNTDAQALENSPVPTKIQLGVNLTEGLGAGANPEIGEQAALESFDDLKNMLDKNTKMVFITAGMGGGTGTGAAPIIAKQAKDMEILTVGIVTIPFQFEGKNRNEQAQRGVERLRSNVDSLIVINNNKLREVYGNLGFKAGFSKADEVLATASRGIAEVITHHYTQNIDLRDAKTVLSNSGTAIMGSAAASGSNRAHEAIGKALDSPLLNDNKISGAQNVLLLIVSGSEEITIDEIGEINDHIQAEAGQTANIIMGVGDDADLDEAISVTIIATGFNPEQQNVIVNTETKKIIHTLEDEQKAEHDLDPKQGSNTTPSPQKNKIVHSLVDDDKTENTPKNETDREAGLGLIPTSEIIKDMEVDYESINYDEEDFVIIESPKKEAKPEKENNSDEHSSGVDNGQAMFTFDLPLKKTEKVEEHTEPRESSTSQADNKRTVHDLSEEDSNRNRRRADEIEVVPNKKSEEGKRYSLADYMELEKDLDDAQPEKKEEPTIERKTIYSEQKDVSQTDTSEKEETNEEIDPFNTPISEDLKKRASERRARMKNFNYKFRNNSNIDEIEKQPAYKRAGIDLENTNESSNQGNLSRTSVNNDEDEELDMRSNNSFLHDNVD